MASEDSLTLRMRTLGARSAAREVEYTSAAVRGTGKEIEKSSRAMKRANATNSVYTKGLGKLWSVAKYTGLAIGAVAIAMGVKGVKAAQDLRKVQLQTQAVVKSMGATSWTSAKQVGELSERFGDAFAIDPTSIQRAANMLLTFGQIQNHTGKGNNVYTRALKANVGMQAAFNKAGKSNVSASVQLGKALNDPIKGVTALRRVGVMFTKQQQDQITAMVESGNLLGAQKRILKEVEREFPVPKPSPWQRFTYEISELQKQLGKWLLPYLEKGVRWMSHFIEQARHGTGAGGKFVKTVKDIGKAVGAYLINPLKAVIGYLKDLVHGFKEGHAWAVLLVAAIAGFATTYVIFAGVVKGVVAFQKAMIALNIIMDANPLFLVIGAVVGLGVAFFIAYKKIKWFHNAVNNVFNWLKTNWPLVLAILAGPFGLAVLYIVRHFDKIVGLVKGLPGRIASVATGMWDGLKAGLVDALNWIIGKLNAIHFKIPGWVPGVGGNRFGFNIDPIGGDKKPGIKPYSNTGALGNRGLPAPAPGRGHQGLATGGNVMRSGVFDVGERGRETVYLPQGSAVVPQQVTEEHIHIQVGARELAHIVRREGLLAKAST